MPNLRVYSHRIGREQPASQAYPAGRILGGLAMSSIFAALFSSLALAVSGAQAANVYVFSTGNAAIDSAYSAALAARGHAATIGVQ